jgi:hypothetical protein
VLIDIHTHTCRTDAVTRPNGTRYPRPDELVAMLDANGIDRAVILSGVSPECRSVFVTPEEVLGVAAEFPDRLIPFANLDPRMLTNGPNADFGPLLDHYKAAGCRGIGEYAPNLPFDDPLNLTLFEAVEAAGLPLIFHVAPAIGGFYGVYDDLGLPRLERVLKAFPDLVLLGHSQAFWAEISRDVTDGTRAGYPTGPIEPGRVVALMRAYPNLHGDLSANSGFNAISRDREFGLRFLDEFQDRLYFGTDLCNIPQETPIVGWFREIREQGLIREAAHEKIAWRNAARLLALEVGN